MLKFLERFERTIIGILLVFGTVIIVYQVVQLIWNSIQSFSTRFREAGLRYAPEYTRNIAIKFFNILLMMEIMETIKVFSHSHFIKGRIIMIVCLIAASRKSGAGLTLNSEMTFDWEANTTIAFLNPLVTGVTKLGKQAISLGVGPRIPLGGPKRGKPDFGLRGVLTFVFPQ